MKKIWITLLSLLFATSFLAGANQNTKEKFTKLQVQKAKQVEVVKFEPLKPDIERYQKKTETDLSKGYYKLQKNDVRDTGKILLNNYFKESK
ncbi:MAG TPA: hypothetical protein PLF50_07020 [Candidatus Cloacimonadota bacterium]|nr:hypothetical protein [Candidatus Cloacimonadota bacterium]HOV17223.1 hypothetical protein [Candidatus Cloacimonadota bacterium]HQL14372.1 hypothetical protein [Candidatus Cloacimonadota bacterium]